MEISSDKPPIRVLHIASSEVHLAFLQAAQTRARLAYQVYQSDNKDEIAAKLDDHLLDVVIASAQIIAPDIAATVNFIRERDADVALLVLSNPHAVAPDATPAPEGADDVIASGDDFRIDLALSRAVKTTAARRQGKSAARALEDSERRLRALARHLETIKEEERHRIAREIHDDIGATLTALRFEMVALGRTGNIPDAWSERLSSMTHLLEQAVEASHRIQHNLRPPVLDAGLIAALQWQVRDFQERTGIVARFETNQEEPPLSAECAAAMYRVTQESLTNIRKYAQARSVSIQVFATGHDVTLEISDDGMGFDTSLLYATPGFGLRGIIERARGLDGWAEVSSAPGRGATIMFCVPLAVDSSANAN